MKKLFPHIALSLIALQLLLMLGSWIYSAAFPMSGVRSILSGEGLRWLFGHFAEMLATPQLVWLVLLAMAYGGLRKVFMHAAKPLFRERRARQMTLLVLLVYVAVVLLLTVTPHAILLSVTGGLWPSPFSRSLVPMVAFAIITLSTVYGLLAGRLDSLADVYDALLDGIRQAAPLFLFYVLVMQLIETLRFMLP